MPHLKNRTEYLNHRYTHSSKCQQLIGFYFLLEKPLRRTGRLMALTSASRCSLLAPLSPEIRTVRLSNLIKLTPNFWGEGSGVRGKPLTKNTRLILHFAPNKRPNSVKRKPIAPHPPSPSPREFGLRLIKFQVYSSEFTRRGVAIFQI